MTRWMLELESQSIWSRRVCNVMAFGLSLEALGHFCYILLGSRKVRAIQGLCVVLSLGSIQVWVGFRGPLLVLPFGRTSFIEPNTTPSHARPTPKYGRNKAKIQDYLEPVWQKFWGPASIILRVLMGVPTLERLFMSLGFPPALKQSVLNDVTRPCQDIVGASKITIIMVPCSEYGHSYSIICSDIPQHHVGTW